MKQFNFILPGSEGIEDILHSEEIRAVSPFRSLLVQVYSARGDSEWYCQTRKTIQSVFPDAVVVGASSVGEIVEGEIHTSSTVLLFSFFEQSSLTTFSSDCRSGSEDAVGAMLAQNISCQSDIRGVLVLSTPVSNDSGRVFKHITRNATGYPVFGGGAGYNAGSGNTLIFDGSHCYTEGFAVVVFTGGSLRIELLSSLGWHPLSREMTITGTGEMSVTTIDDKPAFSVYEKYLGIKADENFFRNSLEFPFLFYDGSHTVARTPFYVNEENRSIQLLSAVNAGDRFRIGYGDPGTILAESAEIQKRMSSFNPEAIFLYTCICRRFLMQEDVDLETRPFNDIAPTGGFYTFGEFYSDRSFSSLLNSTLVAVGFREGSEETVRSYGAALPSEKTEASDDPYNVKHSRILSRLLYFINILTNELEEQNAELKSLIEQKNQFLGIAAHDLRNPAGIILGFSELLKDKTSEEAKYFAEIIQGESSRMLQLINDLLDITKIEAGRLELKKMRTDYAEVVTKSIRINDFLARRKNIRILSDISGDDIQILIDRAKIDQVLNNLIGNAIKYSYPDTEITIRVLREGDSVMTQVIDHGQGIPEKEIGEIFHPFTRSSVRPTSGEASHGLGLAIVKKIVEGHNGRVGVDSEYGKGSVFYFTLPL